MPTKTQKMLSGSVLRTVALFANGGVAFLLMPFLVRHLGDRLYGFWALAGTFAGYYGMLDFGLTGSVCQYISRAIGRKDDEECNLVFNTALRIHSLLGGVVLLATIATAALAPVICHNPQDASLFWKVILLVGATMALGFPINTYQGLLVAELRYDVISWLSLLTMALRTILIVWAILTGHGLIGVAWATLFASVPGFLLTLWITKKRFPWIQIHAGPLDRKTTKNLFSYSSYLFIVDIGDRLRFGVDPVVITAFVGLAAVTHYRFATVFTDQYMRIMISAVGVFWPLLSQLHGANEDAKTKRAFFFATKISVCLASFICFGLIAWGRPMILRWMGPRYLDSYGPLVVLTLSMLLDLWQLPTVSLLFATFKHRVYALTTLVEGVLNLVVSLMLVRHYGILGVALGTLVAAIVIRIFVQPWVMCRATQISYPDYMRFLGWNTLRCAALIGVSYLLLSWGLRPNYFYLFASAACASVLYAVGSWLVVFNKNERELFLAAVRKRVKKQGPAPVLAPVEAVYSGAAGSGEGQV